MGRREDNIKVFADTRTFVNEDENLRKSVADTINRQKIIFAEDFIPKPEKRRNRSANIIVSGKRTLEAASAYKDKNVCVLNFASAKNPGGGVENGSSAQEESLCRCSTLYFVLSADEMMAKFYKPHRKAKNPFYNDDLIYSPDVCVIKTDSHRPERLHKSDQFMVNVITCAAPNLRLNAGDVVNTIKVEKIARISDDELSAIFEKRVDRIIATAAAEDNDVLILGAFGCGAFCNPPEIVARAFHKVLDGYIDCFETVEFAVCCTDHETDNFKEFKKEFG